MHTLQQNISLYTVSCCHGLPDEAIHPLGTDALAGPEIVAMKQKQEQFPALPPPAHQGPRSPVESELKEDLRNRKMDACFTTVCFCFSTGHTEPAYIAKPRALGSRSEGTDTAPATPLIPRPTAPQPLRGPQTDLRHCTDEKCVVHV